MIFRIRDVKKYEKCPKKFYLSKQIPEVRFPYAVFAYSYLDLAKQFLKIEDSELMVGEKGQTTQETLLGFRDKTWLMKGRFEAQKLRASLSFLKNVTKEEEHETNFERTCDIDGSVKEHMDSERIVVDYYVLCHSNYPKELEGQRIALEVWLLEQCGIKIREYYLIHLNADYIREEELEVASLFCLSTTFYKEANKAGRDIKRVVEKKYHDLSDVLLEMEAILLEEHVSVPYHLACTSQGKCTYYETCFNEEVLPDDSIVFLSQTRKKYEMLERGIKLMTDIDFDEFPLSYLQYAQVQSARSGEVFVDTVALTDWMSRYFEEPLCFIDFEWDTIAIPIYPKMRPYDVLLFEFSLHIQEHGTLRQVDFLQTGDCRIAFIEALLEHVPSHGSIIAYHAEGAEKLRLKTLAEQFPEYAVPLLKLCDRMVDLTYPFMQGIVYHPKMRGTYSLKKLLSVIQPDHNYQELTINHGLKAVAAYRTLESLPPKERELLIAELKAYCSLDTYAMVVVVNYLKELLKKQLT